MRKELLIVGTIILAIGITMVGTSLFATEHILSGFLNSAKGGDTMYAGQNGDYYSTILNVKAGDYVDVVSDAPHYLVPSGRLSIINSTNVETYAIAANQTSENRSLYTNLNGSYYVVVFGSSSPVVGYTLIKSPGGFISEVALLGFGGFSRS
jgi:hypothetical protein